jgi:D-alanyl-D-alanine carboxypeptidase (penicillin-binding protein 5/6)
LVSLIALAFGAAGAAAQTSTPSSPNSSTKRAAPCPGAANPPPIPPGANDDSGAPAPETLPEPPALAVPEAPIGGDRMGECGVVLPPNALLPPDGLNAASWLIADQNTGDILAAHAPHARQHPASLIKILLAIVVLRELDPNAVVIGAEEDTTYTGKVGVVADARYSVKDLVRALIVTPANDAASALARQLGGEQQALDKMNELAEELGALDTRAMNPTGLDAPGMSTSAYDAATDSKVVAITAQGGRTKKITRTNDNRLLEQYPGATGGKPGLTDAAKSTFVGSAERDGKRLIVTLLRTEKTGGAPFDEAAALLDYGFRMAAADTDPVGKLVGNDGATPTSEDPQLQARFDQDDEIATANMSRTAFGNVGLPITIAAGVAVMITVAMAFRRRMARARRAGMANTEG